MKPKRNGKSDAMREQERTQRNSDPHAPARAAMWLWGERYSHQRGGSMDFWDTLDAPEQHLARQCANAIREARPERLFEFPIAEGARRK